MSVKPKLGKSSMTVFTSVGDVLTNTVGLVSYVMTSYRQLQKTPDDFSFILRRLLLWVVRDPNTFRLVSLHLIQLHGHELFMTTNLDYSQAMNRAKKEVCGMLQLQSVLRIMHQLVPCETILRTIWSEVYSVGDKPDFSSEFVTRFGVAIRDTLSLLEPMVHED